MNGIERRGFVSDRERLMRDDLAELREMMRLGGRIPGDEQKIEMIENLLARWHKIALIMPLIHDDDESQFQAANLNLTRVRARTSVRSRSSHNTLKVNVTSSQQKARSLPWPWRCRLGTKLLPCESECQELFSYATEPIRTRSCCRRHGKDGEPS
jgi:hypothetical protein